MSNWRWLKTLAGHLHDEYKFRYGEHKQHKAALTIEQLPEPNIVDKGLTPFALAMPDEFKHNDPVQAYRNYYNGAKKHLFEFGSRGTPDWVKKFK